MFLPESIKKPFGERGSAGICLAGSGGLQLKRILLCGVAAIAALSPLCASAETREEAAALFGARQSVLDVSLSPSGNRLVYIVPAGPSTEAVYVVDLVGEPAPRLVFAHSDRDSEIASCSWATDKRLICQAYYVTPDAGVLLDATRLFALDDDGRNMIVLSGRDDMDALGIRQDGGSVVALNLPDNPGHILMTREWVEERSIGTRLANSEKGLGVEQVDVTNGRTRRVESPHTANMGFIADDRGRIRIRVSQLTDPGGYLRPERRYHFRDADSDGWKPLSEIDTTDDDDPRFLPVAVDAGRNVAYGFIDQGGFDAVAAMALDGSGTREVVLARNDVDVDQLIRIGRQRRVVGVSYATEKREIAYLDPELRALAAQFQNAVAGKPLIEIVGASTDEKRLLLIASSDTDPGMLYLFDKGKRELSELLALREPLVGRPMGQMSPITFPASDGTSIPGYLTLPPGSDGKGLPAIVLPHGGPGSRDEWGFDWLPQFFAARGYAVLQPNFRGSAGYGSAWFGRNGFQAWRTAIGDVNDAGRWLVAQGTADPAKLAIVGWSYGGYAALQSQVLDNGLYKAVVAIAPVTDLEELRQDSRRYTNARMVERFIGQGEHVAQGSPARNANAFAAPVLLFHGTRDLNVGVEQSRLMRARLEERDKRVKYVEYDGLDHYIDDTAARTGMLVEIDKFLDDALGG